MRLVKCVFKYIKLCASVVGMAFFLAAMIVLSVRVVVIVAVSVAVVVTMGSVSVTVVMTMSSVTVTVVAMHMVAVARGEEPVSSVVVGDVCESSVLDVSSKQTFLGEGRGVLL